MTKATSTEVETVWVLASGSYSDYRVHCVVRGGEAEAKMLAARANASGNHYDQYEVEELAIVDADVKQVEILKLSVEIFDNGGTKELRQNVRIEWPFDALFGTPALHWRWVRAPMYNGKGGRLEVWGSDHERVRKVFSDRRAMYLTDDAMRAKREAEGRR